MRGGSFIGLLMQKLGLTRVVSGLYIDAGAFYLLSVKFDAKLF